MQAVTAADGTAIAYGVSGAGPLLLLLHGITEDQRLWAPVVDRLCTDFTCVTIDFRGHGESEPSRNGYDAFTMAGDVAAVVEAISGDDEPVLVGHSLGAFVASAYAAGALGPVRGIVNVDQTLRMTDFAAVVRPMQAELEGDGFAAVMAAFPDLLGVDALPADVAARVRAYDRAGMRDVVLGVWQPLFEMPDEELTALVETDLLPNLRVPYLVLHGDDPGTDYVDWLTARVPTATVEIWGGGHWLHLGNPDRFVSRVRDFVAAI